MGRYCEAAMCWSHDNKRKNLQKYPWMRDVTWVKFPGNSTVRATWKKLLRRQDKFDMMTSLLVRDYVRGISTKSKFKMMDMQLAFQNIFTGTIMD